MQKVCTKCGETKAFSAFAPKAGGRHGLRSECKACRSQYAKAYRAKNIEEHRAANRERMAKIREADPGYAMRMKTAWKHRNLARFKAQRKAHDLRRRAKAAGLSVEEYVARKKAMEAGYAKAAAAREKRNAERTRARVADWKHVTALRHIVKRSIPSGDWTSAEIFRWRYRNDPAFAAAQRLRNQMRKTMTAYSHIGHYLGLAARKRRGYSAMWEILGYGPDDLRRHLERQFTKGMTWAKFMAGEIHIDHIIPKSAFACDTIEDVRACHGLANLQPMWARDNLAKSARRVALV